MHPQKTNHSRLAIFLVLLVTVAATANAQTFRVQCPTTTTTHPDGTGIKCQQLSGGDGFATMADGTQTYLFAFGPLSGLADIRNGLPGTGTPATFNLRGDMDALGVDPLVTDFNGAVGLVCNPDPGPNEPVCTDPDTGPFTGHVDPFPIMQVGIMNGNMPQSRLCRSSASTVSVISSLHTTRCASITRCKPPSMNCLRARLGNTTP